MVDKDRQFHQTLVRDTGRIRINRDQQEVIERLLEDSTLQIEEDETDPKNWRLPKFKQ